MHALQLLCGLAAVSTAAGANSTVYIIRHGEKTFGGGCLNIQGQERANHLGNGNVFGKNAPFKEPVKLFAHQYERPQCQRCWLTVQPLAQALKLDIEYDIGHESEFGGNEKAAKVIRKSAQTNDVILVSYEHGNIQYLSALLGVPKSVIPYWKGSDYDSVYELTLDASTGAFLAFDASKQGYVPKSTTCPPHFVNPPNTLAKDSFVEE